MRDNVISSFIKRQLGISKLELWGEQAKEKLLWEKYFRKKINQQQQENWTGNTSLFQFYLKSVAEIFLTCFFLVVVVYG